MVKMTWLHTTIKLAPSADCWTTHDGDTVCPLPGDPFPDVPHQTIPSSWGGYTVGDCKPALKKASADTPLSALPSLCANPLFNSDHQMTAQEQAVNDATFAALMGDPPAPPVDFAGLFIGAALLAGVVASGVAMLLAKLRRKNLAKQEATA